MALLVPLSVVLVVVDPLGVPVVVATRRVAVWASGLFRLNPVEYGSGLVSFERGGAQYAYRITEACSPLLPALLFVAAVLAYPARWSQRALGIAVGLPVLFLFNTFRLIALAFVGLYRPAAFGTAHLFWFQGFLIVAVGIGWLAWVRLVVDADRAVRYATPASRDLARAVVTFAASFTALAVAGLAIGLHRVYGAIVDGVTTAIVTAARPREFIVIVRDPEEVLVDFAAAAAMVSLFFATQGPAPRRRVIKAVTWGLPLLLVGHVVAGLVTVLALGGGGALGPGALSRVVSGAVSLFAFWVLPLTLWYSWARRFRRPRLGHSQKPDRALVCSRRG